LEQEALSLFRLGDPASSASSANETDSSFAADGSYMFDVDPLLSAHGNPGLSEPIPDTAPGPTNDDFFSSSFFNMDLDDAFETSLPPLPPSNFSLQDLSLQYGSTRNDQNMNTMFTNSEPPPLFASHTHSSHGNVRSPVPFSFHGGAPCILPPPPITGKVISLNSDDELDHPQSGSHFKHQRPLHHKVHGSDSSHPSKHSASALYSRSSDGSKPAPAVSTPPTSVHDTSSVASSSRRSATKGKRAQASPVVSANEQLVMQADDLIAKGMSMAESLRNERSKRCDVHYQDKEAERNHQQWLAQFNADHEKSMARLRLEQLDRELELEKLCRSAN